MISGTASMSINANYRNKTYSSAGRKTKTRKTVCYASDMVEKIDSFDSTLSFYVPIFFSYRIEDGLFCADYNAGGLVIASAESSREGMVADMKAQFKHAWNYYALESDDKLTEGAKAVKKWLINHVRSV